MRRDSVVPVTVSLLAIAFCTVPARPVVGAGADVTVSQITQAMNWGTRMTCSGSGQSCVGAAECPTGEDCNREITAFSVGTIGCNSGDVPLKWCDNDSVFCNKEEHPVIAQNMYRLRDGKFEQIGLSWVKHGFAAIDNAGCTQDCVPTGNDDLLSVGCWDLYGAQLNGQHRYLGPRSEINPLTGVFPFPYTLHPKNETGDDIFKRLQVHTSDLDAGTNGGALYFVEGHYITPDDAAAGNGLNNASYRRVTVAGPVSGNRYLAQVQDTSILEQAAIRAWKANQPSVVETNVDIPAEGRLILAGNATLLGNGFWRYEYALFNMNSDCAAGTFFVPLPLGAMLENVGFHDVDYHTDEPYDGTDWAVTINGPGITWSTVPHSSNVNANALRFSTLYNFRFDTNVEPEWVTGSATIGLFKPFTPSDMTVITVSPTLAVIDCNDNGIADSDDIAMNTSNDCDSNGVPDECQADCNVNMVADTCDIAQGTSLDCNVNTIPDSCEVDCNTNGIPDDCDLVNMTSTDCNSNGVPDECDPDCNQNGITDGCNGDPALPDTDGDGVDDCSDLCPLTTPPDACDCPPGCCQFPGFLQCPASIPWDDCLQAGGVPDCIPYCQDGCLIGDADEDGMRNLADFAAMQICFTGPDAGPCDVGDTSCIECRRIFDDDDDDDVDLVNYERWRMATFVNP